MTQHQCWCEKWQVDCQKNVNDSTSMVMWKMTSWLSKKNVNDSTSMVVWKMTNVIKNEHYGWYT